MTHEAFRAALAGLHMSQATFARTAGINPRTVRRWASGESPVPTTVAVLLRTLLEVSETGGLMAVRRALQK